MQTFADELRRSREERKISLEQVAESTLINIRFLEAIERGDMSVLPQAYVRAFIREYASVIGLDPAEVMRRYDEALARSSGGAELPKEPSPPRPAPEEHPPDAPPGRPRSRLARNAAIIVALAAVAGLVIVFGGRNGSAPPQEVAFQDVVREHEARTTPQQTAAQSPTAQPVAVDSLTLSASTTDSVWVQLTIDAGAPQEFLFAPGRKRSWKAQEKFVVTLGNAGAVQFTLNGIPLGTLGKPGAVVRNAEFSRAQLQRR